LNTEDVFALAPPEANASKRSVACKDTLQTLLVLESGSHACVL